MPDTNTSSEPLDVSFVVIGYNEGKTLGACLRAVRDADLDGIRHELIYVDAGSADDSMRIAQEAGADHVLGGDQRRKAAEARNVGLHAATGEFVQFIDGDMTLAPDWPRAAFGFLRGDSDYAVVCGGLREANRSLLFRALQLDWTPSDGDVPYCGGAALFRRETLEQAGGFPEDVAYGEEPYLCWRIRNELGKKVYCLARVMADHDLGFSGFGDYWRRSVRTGATYAEIAARCRGTSDPLWSGESRSNTVWALATLAWAAVVIAAPWPVKAAALLVAVAVLTRKALQKLRAGHGLSVAAVYALHSYFVKIPLAYGQLKWRLKNPR